MDIWNGSFLAGVVGAFLAGLPMVTAGIRRENRGGDAHEPSFSIGLVLCYVSLAYLVLFPLRPLLGRGFIQWIMISLIPMAAHVSAISTRFSIRRRRPNNLLSLRGISGTDSSSVYISRSPQDYRHLIVPAENGATTIDRVPKRISVVFKSSTAVRRIAEQRFGIGSSNVNHYVQEHGERTADFYRSLDGGLTCREIYSKSELVEYVSTGRHGTAVTVPAADLRDNLERWMNCLATHQSYIVAFTDERLPFKYEVVDSRLVVMHEAVGSNDRGRLNAVAIDSTSVADSFREDFDTIWDRIPPIDRDRGEVIKWIQDNLVTLLEEA